MLQSPSTDKTPTGSVLDLAALIRLLGRRLDDPDVQDSLVRMNLGANQCLMCVQELEKLLNDEDGSVRQMIGGIHAHLRGEHILSLRKFIIRNFLTIF
jgi:hypothetical protein